jgi:hypothetical protein
MSVDMELLAEERHLHRSTSQHQLWSDSNQLRLGDQTQRAARRQQQAGRKYPAGNIISILYTHCFAWSVRFVVVCGIPLNLVMVFPVAAVAADDRSRISGARGRPGSLGVGAVRAKSQTPTVAELCWIVIIAVCSHATSSWNNQTAMLLCCACWVSQQRNNESSALTISTCSRTTLQFTFDSFLRLVLNCQFKTRHIFSMTARTQPVSKPNSLLLSYNIQLPNATNEEAKYSVKNLQKASKA